MSQKVVRLSKESPLSRKYRWLSLITAVWSLSTTKPSASIAIEDDMAQAKPH
ncbi:hypothetical protein ACFSJQ_03340 [Vibrio olivae]